MLQQLLFDLMQAYMALAAGADYIAPYVNQNWEPW